MKGNPPTYNYKNIIVIKKFYKLTDTPTNNISSLVTVTTMVILGRTRIRENYKPHTNKPYQLNKHKILNIPEKEKENFLKYDMKTKTKQQTNIHVDIQSHKS